MLPKTSAILSSLLDDMIADGIVSHSSYILYVDDGSLDTTWQILKDKSESNEGIVGVKLSRNFGHQNALMCGMMNLRSDTDCVITIDADLQDDTSVIREMMKKYAEGSEIVYGVRSERKTDSFFKKTTALLFYKIIKLLGVDIIYNHADFRLVSSNALKQLEHFSEVNLFLRGVFPLLGFNCSTVEYDRLERDAGETKYTIGRMISFALDGVSSFSIKPLRFIAILGFLLFSVSVILSIYSLFSFFFGSVVPGWTSTTLSLYLLSGIQLLCLGVLGEYVGKIYQEVKQRPRYIIETTTDRSESSFRNR